ncbi:MAG: short-chain dehydrogenase [Cycloclasticus sp.]|nr:short-chain dehydrogenase [Cycloclasticus sp.]MBG95955.1 short-chain dehydrogenase [Cycloclasticus sp.]
MTARMEGHNAIVTGSSSGMGRATAIRLASEGASVCLADINKEGNAETLELIKQQGGRAIAEYCDVSDEALVKKMTAAAEAAFGSVSILFNNAGFEDGDGNTDELDVDAWEKVQSINTRGVFLAAKYALKSMIAGGKGGSITTTSSIGGLIGTPGGLHSYCASKGAVISLTRSWAVTYAPHNIRANAICPGLVLTDMVQRIGPEFIEAASSMTPLGRGAEPEEIANLVAFLSSEESRFITGTIIPIDGGYTAQ